MLEISRSPAVEDLAPHLAAAHQRAFHTPWSVSAFKTLIVQPGVAVWCADAAAAQKTAKCSPALSAFVMARFAADEAEILTLAVVPPARRTGIGRRLVKTVCQAATKVGATVFLEVDGDNFAAISLYRGVGFVDVGRRTGYYRQSEGPPKDAMVMRWSSLTDR